MITQICIYLSIFYIYFQDYKRDVIYSKLMSQSIEYTKGCSQVSVKPSCTRLFEILSKTARSIKTEKFKVHV